MEVQATGTTFGFQGTWRRRRSELLTRGPILSPHAECHFRGIDRSACGDLVPLLPQPHREAELIFLPERDPVIDVRLRAGTACRPSCTGFGNRSSAISGRLSKRRRPMRCCTLRRRIRRVTGRTRGASDADDDPVRISVLRQSRTRRRDAAHLSKGRLLVPSAIANDLQSSFRAHKGPCKLDRGKS